MGSDGGLLGKHYHGPRKARSGFRQKPKTNKKQRRRPRK